MVGNLVKSICLFKYKYKQYYKMRVLRKITNNFSIYQGTQLGSGQFGTVVLGYFAEERKDVAVKIISQQIITLYELLYQRETEVLSKLNEHDKFSESNIIQFYGYFKKEGVGYLFFELCKNNLRDMILNDPVPQKTVMVYFKQIMNGIAFLHSEGIIHRDLKPENILSDEKDILKIADFGLSREYDQGNTLNMTQKVGNYAFQAPEARTKHYDARCDVWSAGLILYQLLAGTICREYSIINEQGIDRRNNDIREGKISFKFQGFEPIWQRLLKKMLVYDYTQRSTSAEIFEEYNQWLKEYETRAQNPKNNMKQTTKKLFKTFAQFEQQKQQTKKEQGQQKMQRFKVTKNQIIAQQQLIEKKIEFEIYLSLKEQESFLGSIINYIEYLNYYNNYKRFSDQIAIQIIQLVKESGALKKIYNNFFILTSCFFLESVVYLKYSQLLVEMDGLFSSHPKLKDQLDLMPLEKQQQYKNLIETKRRRFKNYVNLYLESVNLKLKKRILYRQKLQLGRNCDIVFEYLGQILDSLKEMTSENLLEHLNVLYADVELDVTKRQHSKEELKAIYLLIKLRKISQEMSGSFHLMTVELVNQISSELEHLPIDVIMRELSSESS